MGKSGTRKKKGGSNPASSATNSTPNANGGVHLDSSIFLKTAHELKEEGNKRFQNKDFVGALEQYESALRLTPKTHPDGAVFHSNRAACLMQMKPIDYDTVISECTMALQVQPRFVRALLRRARAFEAIGKYELAMQDVQVLLVSEPNHRDALEDCCWTSPGGSAGPSEPPITCCSRCLSCWCSHCRLRSMFACPTDSEEGGSLHCWCYSTSE